MKNCFKCEKLLPLLGFYKHSGMADGHLNKCKTCSKKDNFEYRYGKGREKVLTYDLERSKNPQRKASAKKIISEWRKKYPDRKKAQYAVNNAIRDGRLTKWPICALPECNKPPEAHHPDYSQPLSVVWLCSAHHKQAHALAKI